MLSLKKLSPSQELIDLENLSRAADVTSQVTAASEKAVKLTLVKDPREAADLAAVLAKDSRSFGAIGIAEACDRILLEVRQTGRLPIFLIEGLQEVVRKTIGILQVCSSEAPSTEVRRILFVDDEPDLVAILGEYFESRGYRISRAGSAEEALDILKLEKIDAIVTDWTMPGMQGHVFASRVKELYEGRIPVVMVTGRLIDEDETTKKAGIRAVLSKPFDMQTLWTMLTGLIG